MKILVDTNILVDIALAREPFAESSLQAWTRISAEGELPLIAPHSLATFYYLVKQAHDNARANLAVDDLLLTGRMADFPSDAVTKARELSFSDFEDAMIAAAAVFNQCELILTRNPNDFAQSPISCQTPDEYLRELT